MRLFIDNQDGTGALDYSSRLSPDAAIMIERELNTPSRCSLALNLYGCSLPTPARKGRVRLQSDDGTLLFTGYLSLDPEMSFLGTGTLGAAYKVLIRAVGDDWILDRDGTPLRIDALSEPTGQMLRTLVQQLPGANQISIGGISDGRSLGVLQIDDVGGWSANAKLIAGSTCSSYRVLDAQVGVSPLGEMLHSFQDVDSSLQKERLRLVSDRQLANDVTVSGDLEPTSYIAEYFVGDGNTSLFNLTETPFHAASNGTASVLEDSFDQEEIDRKLWNVSDPGSHLFITGAGLTMNGGSGIDGQTTLKASNLIELGGSLIFEIHDVRLEQPSTGILCGVYVGSANMANCFAGYSVRQSSDSTIVSPLVNGIEAGTSFSLVSGHRYDLRIRTHCPEMHRVKQAYYTLGGKGAPFGGGLVPAPLQIVFELRDLGSGSSTPSLILYDGEIPNSPATATYVATNSTQIYGSISSCSIRQSGSSWVASTLPSGTRFTRLTGQAADGADCTISNSGKITFLPGRIPIAGEVVEVVYRSKKRSVARVADGQSIAVDIAGGLRGPARWVGEVQQPRARNSEDCENAAAAILSYSADPRATLRGEYEADNPQDVWPGDSLQFQSDTQSIDLIARRITICSDLSSPEVLRYHLGFAGEWVEPLGIRTSEKIAADAAMPQMAQFGAGKVLANLQKLRLVSADSHSLQVDTGADAPVGGGFEIRRRENGFGDTSDADLVLRSAVRSFSIPRESQVERYFVRMYDDSTPPVYSRFASAVFTDLPVS